MTRPARFLIGGVIIGALVAGWLWSRKSGERVVLDLVEALPKAKERQPNPESQSIVDATISGDTRKAILITSPGRIKYELTVPERAWFKLAIGMLEKGWTVAGDGVTVFLYVTPLGPDGKVMFSPEGKMIADELLSLTVNPYGNPADKLWHDLTLDLGQYAGKRVDLTLVTRPSPTQQTWDVNGDFLVWGQPRVVVN
jgi:hypothetical protein